jgi:2-dehydro-3-deoxyphosphogluconate aldolase / (4S)-4-hydroxy-2-oxoglutarate aldolase
MNLAEILRLAPVIPVVTIDQVKDAVPLARALVKGGLPVIEVTLRTGAGLQAIRAIADEVPEAAIGAGTVLTEAHFDKAVAAGAQFAVSPGATGQLLDAVSGREVQLLPGIATASEAMALIERGYEFAKLFPAEAVGGAALLSALAGPLPHIKFCPTGGVTLENAPKYLKLPNVVCVGGSWMVSRAAITAGDWDGITMTASAAAALHVHRTP